MVFRHSVSAGRFADKRDYAMEKKIRRDLTIEDWALLIAWAAFFLPPVVARITSAASHAVNLLGYAAFLFLFIRRKNDFPFKTDVMLFLTFLGYCIIILLIKTPGEFALLARRNLLPAFESFFLVRWTFDRKKRGFGILYHVCAFYITANFLSLLLFPGGIIRSAAGSAVERAQWLFGSKNNIPLYMILFITIAAYYYYTVRRTRAFYMLVFMVTFSILMSGEESLEFLGGSSTGFVAFLAAVALVAYYLYCEKTQRGSIGVKSIFILILVMNLIILTGQSIPGMKELIVNVFHKTVTFTGRTLIWGANMKAIAQNPVFGHGEESVMAHVRINKEWVHTDYTYNLILKILLNYGAVGLGLFVSLILRITRGHETSDCILFAGFFGIMFIGMMNEVDMQWLLLFPAMLTAFQNSLPPTTAGRARRIRSRKRKSLGLHVTT